MSKRKKSEPNRKPNGGKSFEVRQALMDALVEYSDESGSAPTMTELSFAMAEILKSLAAVHRLDADETLQDFIAFYQFK